MNQKLILKIFLIVTGLALILRLFVLNIVFISNNDLEPHFLAGDVVLVLKMLSPRPEKWVLLQSYPSQGNYSMRRLAHEVNQGEWAISAGTQNSAEMPTISAKKILGRAVMILWSRSCTSPSDACESRPSKFLAVIN